MTVVKIPGAARFASSWLTASTAARQASMETGQASQCQAARANRRGTLIDGNAGATPPTFEVGKSGTSFVRGKDHGEAPTGESCSRGVRARYEHAGGS